MMSDLLQIYRERLGSPDFWAEPFNALTNASFLVSAAFGLHLAIQRQAATPISVVLISLAGIVGVGSFLFHTVPTPVTMWLDVIPIAAVQILLLWLVSHEMLGYTKAVSAGIVTVVIGLSFALMPVHQPLNGSLFYVPSFVAMLVLGAFWYDRGADEPYLLLAAAAIFALAIAARSSDWRVSWSVGSHFLWHLLNGVVVYLLIRSWILHVT